ncbi:MAG: putative ABC transporter permease [Eubacterium sp.]|jgi:uncharacterized membrane protein|nr:putative ABC transporter permease [Eubacterium sp.]
MTGIGIRHWLFLMLIFMFIGWVQESALESFSNKKFINRGFLTGPYIPIYGFGGLFMIFSCDPLVKVSPKPIGIFLVFFAGALGCTIIEFLTGIITEKALKRRLWDYDKLFMLFADRIKASKKLKKFLLKLVYKKYITLPTFIIFGLVSVALVYLFPIVKPAILKIDNSLILMVDISAGVIVVVDFIGKTIKSNRKR